jgi:CheY-like chemotaxis protein
MKFLNLMGSQLEVKSVYGEGSVFYFFLTQNVIDPTPIGDFEEAQKELKSDVLVFREDFTAPDARVLVVDDVDMNLKVFRGLLNKSMIQIDTASSGRQAIELITYNRYDCIFMDHQMPEMDGIECLHRIRDQENGKCKDSKIVCLTANVGAEMEKQFMQEGFDGYLSKPVNGKILESELVRLTTVDLIR